MTLQPIGDNVVLKIKDREREEVRQSGLIVMNQGTEQTLRMEIGEVIAVGEGRTKKAAEMDAAGNALEKFAK